MSAASDDGFPTRAAEIHLLEDALERKVPALGVCLGAQLLAIAAGGKVYPGADGPEIGWAPVSLVVEETERDPLFRNLPQRADRAPLARGYLRPATRGNPPGFEQDLPEPSLPGRSRAWGLQFHLEVDVAAVDGMVRAFPDDAALAAGGAPAVIRTTPEALAALAPWRDLVFDRFTAMVTAGLGEADHVAVSRTFPASEL